MRVIIKNLQKKIPINPKRAKSAVLSVLSSERALKKSGEPRPSLRHRALFKEGRGEITVCFVDDKQIRELNLMYLGRDTATDVIAFDNSVKKGELLADIAISTDTAIRNARSFKTNPLDEVRLYIIHGVLHLLGYDDNNGRNALIMRERQELLWQSIKPRQ